MYVNTIFMILDKNNETAYEKLNLFDKILETLIKEPPLVVRSWINHHYVLHRRHSKVS
jgi:hypothetical protein